MFFNEEEELDIFYPSTPKAVFNLFKLNNTDDSHFKFNLHILTALDNAV